MTSLPAINSNPLLMLHRASPLILMPPSLPIIPSLPYDVLSIYIPPLSKISLSLPLLCFLFSLPLFNFINAMLSCLLLAIYSYIIARARGVQGTFPCTRVFRPVKYFQLRFWLDTHLNV